MSATPIRDVALCIELQQRAIHALMTRPDWEREIDRLLDGGGMADTGIRFTAHRRSTLVVDCLGRSDRM